MDIRLTDDQQPIIESVKRVCDQFGDEYLKPRRLRSKPVLKDAGLVAADVNYIMPALQKSVPDAVSRWVGVA